MTGKELLNVKQVCEMLGIGEQTAWRLRDAGRMPSAIKLGKCVRWRKADLMAWVEAGCPDVKKTGWTNPAFGLVR